MNVGLYLDLRGTGGQDRSADYGFALEVCEEADRLGCHSIWLTEHHLFDDGYLPQPLTMAAAIAARTRSVRIGTAVLLAPMRHAAHIAEESAIVDLLSGGRLELGLGAGYRLPEFELFDASMSERYAATDAAVRDVRRLWEVVTPSPAQRPIPLWLGYQGPRGARRAGRLGVGLLSADAALWPHYLQGLDESGHGETSGRMAGNVQAWVTEDPERDWPLVSKHLARQVDSYLRHMVEGTDQPLPPPVDPERLRSRGRERKGGGPLSYFLYGTPEDVAPMIAERSGGVPVETVFMWASLAGMEADLVMNHVRCVCQTLGPLLAG